MLVWLQKSPTCSQQIAYVDYSVVVNTTCAMRLPAGLRIPYCPPRRAQASHRSVPVWYRCRCWYRFTWGRGQWTLAQDSGRRRTIEKKSRMAVLFSSTRGVSCRREFFSRYSHLKKVHSQQLSLEKVHTRSQTVTPSDDKVTCEIRRGFESSDQADLTYPP